MIEIRFHGRGGQGTVVASEVLANAFFAEGRFVQAFPTFGVERRGAPVAAFLRVDDNFIRLRCQIEKPDHLVVLDPTLIPVLDLTAGLKKGGWILINSEHSPSDFSSFVRGGWKVATADASAIAVKYRLGSATNPIVNTAILGAFSKATGLVQIESVIKAIREGFPHYPDRNNDAALEASELVQMRSIESNVSVRAGG